MRKSSVAHMLLYPGVILLPAHHQMLSYCSLDSHMKSKFLASWDYSYRMLRTARISAWSLVSSLRSSSLHLNRWSLLALTTLEPAFLDSSKLGPNACYCS